MTTLTLPATIYGELLEHLEQGPDEQVAFLYGDADNEGADLSTSDLYRVPPEGFVGQSSYHLALTDDVRGEVISRAWEKGGALIEAHSHPGAREAEFSWTDLRGFDEWVPHVRWRLRGATYIALVFAESDFDALVWAGEHNDPTPLTRLSAGELDLQPSNLTLASATDE
jgi:proteasome lid subunit RPN8/RPN11